MYLSLRRWHQMNRETPCEVRTFSRANGGAVPYTSTMLVLLYTDVRINTFHPRPNESKYNHFDHVTPARKSVVARSPWWHRKVQSTSASTNVRATQT